MSEKLFITPVLLEGVGTLNTAVKAMADQTGTDDPQEAIRRFNSGEYVLKPADPPVFKLLATIKIGTGLKPKDFKDPLNRDGHRSNDWANDMIKQSAFTVSTTEAELDLVAPTVAELGLKKGGTKAEIEERAKQLGLELCPAEVGPQLRLQYLDQPKDEWLRIAMDPIVDSDGGRRVFSVAHGGDGLWLSSGYGGPDGFWSARCRWVFVRPRK